LETLISPELFQDECHGRSAREPNEADIGVREAIVVLNPNKYTVKEDDEDDMKQEQASLNDSIDEDEEQNLVRNKKKPKKKPGKVEDDAASHRSNALPPTNLGLDPVELMPNLKLGQKERRQ
jgi:hypothetical protein